MDVPRSPTAIEFLTRSRLGNQTEYPLCGPTGHCGIYSLSSKPLEEEGACLLGSTIGLRFRDDGLTSISLGLQRRGWGRGADIGSEGRHMGGLDTRDVGGSVTESGMYETGGFGSLSTCHWGTEFYVDPS